MATSYSEAAEGHRDIISPSSGFVGHVMTCHGMSCAGTHCLRRPSLAQYFTFPATMSAMLGDRLSVVSSLRCRAW